MQVLSLCNDPGVRCSATALHRDLNARAVLFARRHNLLHELSAGRHPSVLFCEDDAGKHGNFKAASYRALRANPAWQLRLQKAHTGGKRARPRADWHWRELDCAASSDALLMNIFCHPEVLASPAACALLGVSRGSTAAFGVHPRLARERDLVDTTEIDMELSDGAEPAFFEAKLTESGFQTARASLLARFLGWNEVLDGDALPRTASGSYAGYQLVRGVLAAHASGGSFCLLCDARRIDLVRQWHAVLLAVSSATLRCRLKLLTWQELSAVLPGTLQHFLSEKYGIVPDIL